MFPKYYFPNGENAGSNTPVNTSIPALGNTLVETTSANVRGLMVSQTGDGLQGTTAFLPAITSVAKGLASRKAFGRSDGFSIR